MKTGIHEASLFHFVGHGWSNAGDGGLILTKGGEPAYLTAAALSRLDLSACSLAVLSACMTGTGETHGPFNPRSLVRAFLVSGAHRVVAARWNLDEAATAALMQHFYSSVLHSATPADALALAQRAVLQNPEYRHPTIGPLSPSSVPHKSF
jgi:CHAT domain-containing protein